VLADLQQGIRSALNDICRVQPAVTAEVDLTQPQGVRSAGTLAAGIRPSSYERMGVDAGLQSIR